MHELSDVWTLCNLGFLEGKSKLWYSDVWYQESDIPPLARLQSSVSIFHWGGVLIILHAIVIWPLTSHPYKAGTEHAGFSPDRAGVFKYHVMIQRDTAKATLGRFLRHFMVIGFTGFMWTSLDGLKGKPAVFIAIWRWRVRIPSGFWIFFFYII